MYVILTKHLDLGTHCVCFSFGPRGSGWPVPRPLQSLHQGPDQEGHVAIVAEISPGVPANDGLAHAERMKCIVSFATI